MNNNENESAKMLSEAIEKFNTISTEIVKEEKILEQKRQKMQEKIDALNDSISELSKDKATYERIKEQGKKDINKFIKLLIIFVLIELQFFSAFSITLIAKTITFLGCFTINFNLLRKIRLAKIGIDKNDYNSSITSKNIFNEKEKLAAANKELEPFNKEYDELLTKKNAILMMINYINEQLKNNQASINQTEFEKATSKLTKKI